MLVIGKSGLIAVAPFDAAAVKSGQTVLVVGTLIELLPPRRDCLPAARVRMCHHAMPHAACYGPVTVTADDIVLLREGDPMNT